MIIYNQTSTTKKYIGGILIGFLILPAILLFIQGYIFYAVVLLIVYLIVESSRTGVNFNFDDSTFRPFREVLWLIRIGTGEPIELSCFSHYRINQETEEASVMANWVQNSTISQEQCTLALFDQQKGEFLPIVKSNAAQLQPLLIKLEEQHIIQAD